MKPNTVLIGLTPIGTQFILQNIRKRLEVSVTEAFVETSKGGTNIVTGIGLSTGAEIQEQLHVNGPPGQILI